MEETVRSTVLGARSILVAVLVGALVNLPAMAASEKPLATVVAAQSAHLANLNAVPGADVFLDDTLVTDQGGSLRLKVGSGQVYLLASSEATLQQQENKVLAKVYRGALGFSTPAPEQLEVETPFGDVRGVDGSRVYGQVALVSSEKMVITAYEGALVVERDGQSQTVHPGQAYSVSLVPDASGGGQNQQGGVQGVGSSGVNKGHLLFALLIVGAAAGVAAGLYITQSESCMTPPCN
jgi:hypothetical protein